MLSAFLLEQEVQGICNVELTDKYVNNRNETVVPAVITMNTVLTDTVSDAKIVKVKDDGTYEDVVTKVELTKNTTKIETTFNLKSLDEGKTTLKLVSKDGKTVYATFKADKHTKEIDSASITPIKAIRDNTKEASISFEAYGDNIVKMYYAKTNAFSTYSSNKKGATDKELAKNSSIDITNNKVENQKVYTDLTNNTTASLYYVLIDEYGSIKIGDGEVKIANDEDKDPAATIKKDSVTIDSLESKTDYTEVNVKWDLETGSESGQTFYIALYKDGKAVANATIANAKTTTINALTGFAKIMQEQAGTYKIGIYSKATAEDSKNPSDTVFSNEVTVTALEPVTDVTFNVNADKEKVLTWNSDYAEADIAGYKVKLIKIEDKSEQKLNSDNAVKSKTYKIDEKVTDKGKYTSGTVYKAVVYVAPKTGSLATIQSPDAESKEFFTIDAASLTKISNTSNSVKLQISSPVTVKNKNTTYKVEVWEKTGTDGLESQIYTNTGRVVDVTPDESQQFVVDGLEPGHTYIFKILADVDGVQAISELAPVGGVTLYNKLPSLENLTVVADGAKTEEGQIAKTSSNGLKISGVEYSYGDMTNKYSSELNDVYTLINNSVLTEGDIFTYTSDKLTITLPNKAAAQTPRTFTSAKLEDKILELKGSPNNQVKITSVAQKMKELILTGSKAIFDVTGVTDDSTKKTTITVQDGVEIVNATSTHDLVIAKGATATVNGVKITPSSADIKITPDTSTITVKEEQQSTNDLVFENTSGTARIIKFSGNADDTSRLNGKITLISKGAKISVDHENMSVESAVNVNIENGEVDVANAGFTGVKTITVTVKDGDDKNKLTVLPAAAIPDCISSLTDFTLTEMTVDQIKADTTLKSKVSTNTEKAQSVKAFLDSFKLNDQGVKIDIASGKVTLTFTKAGTYTLTSETNGIK